MILDIIGAAFEAATIVAVVAAIALFCIVVGAA